MPIETFAILRHKGIVYLVKKAQDDGKEPYNVYTYDLENPILIGTWTNKDGIMYKNENVYHALQTATDTIELQEKCERE
jgi:hypothetical protein